MGRFGKKNEINLILALAVKQVLESLQLLKKYANNLLEKMVI